MTDQASASDVVVVRSGEGHRVGNVELLARSADTPRFNIAPDRDPTASRRPAEGELTFGVEAEEVVAGPGTFVLVPPGVEHTFANRGDALVRMVNVHAPAGFDLRLEEA